MIKEINVIFYYLKKEMIPIDKIEFEFQIQSHPDYPSLLSISDTLAFFNIDNGAIRLPFSEIDLLPNFFIAYLKVELESPKLFFVEKRGDNWFYTKDKKAELISKDDLEKRWEDVVLLVEKSDETFESNTKNSDFSWIFSILPLSLFVIFLFLNKDTWQSKLFFVFPIFGIILSIGALKDLFGAKSEILTKFCNITSSTNCSTVVNSSKWKLFDFLNFSDLSIVFFSSQFLGLLISVFSNTSQEFLGVQKLLLLFSIPLLLVSLYYQKFVEKKWCPICLLIIFLISIEICFLYNIKFSYSIKDLFLFGFLFFTIFYVWKLLKSILIKQKELKEFQMKANRFQRNYRLFKSMLLSKNNKVELPNTPIVLGNQNSETTITIITNPFCGHCVKAHETINRILEKHHNDLQVCIIIKADIDYENEDTKDFFRSLLNSYFEQGGDKFNKLLHEWFQNKDLKKWLQKNKSENINIMKIDVIYSNLYSWCNKNQYNYTPAIFINGYEYPSIYERSDIIYFIDELLEDEDILNESV